MKTGALWYPFFYLDAEGGEASFLLVILISAVKWSAFIEMPDLFGLLNDGHEQHIWGDINSVAKLERTPYCGGGWRLLTVTKAPLTIGNPLSYGQPAVLRVTRYQSQSLFFGYLGQNFLGGKFTEPVLLVSLVLVFL